MKTKKTNWKKVGISVFILIFFILLIYTAYTGYQAWYKSVYSKGIADENKILINAIVNQIQTTGKLSLTIPLKDGTTKSYILTLENAK